MGLDGWWGLHVNVRKSEILGEFPGDLLPEIQRKSTVKLLGMHISQDNK